jgi:hypothetical protein
VLYVFAETMAIPLLTKKIVKKRVKKFKRPQSDRKISVKVYILISNDIEFMFFVWLMKLDRCSELSYAWLGYCSSIFLVVFCSQMDLGFAQYFCCACQVVFRFIVCLALFVIDFQKMYVVFYLYCTSMIWLEFKANDPCTISRCSG